MRTAFPHGVAAAMALLLTSCSGATPRSASEPPAPADPVFTPSAPAPPPTLEPVSPPVATLPPGTLPLLARPGVGSPVLDDWAELRPSLHAVYTATLSTRTRADGANELCARVRERLFGEGPVPAELCTPLANVLASHAIWPPLPTEGAAVIVTVQLGAEERLLGAAPESGCQGDCRARYEAILWPGIDCAERGRFWDSVPAADRQCAQDGDCRGLTAMCFAQAVRADRFDYYSEALRHAPPCGHPAAGPCMPRGLGAAVCAQGACAPRD